MSIFKGLFEQLLGFALVMLFVTACTQPPTEKQNVTDMRPQLSFKIMDDELRGATVLVDGLAMGSIGEFGDGVAALRVLSGNHHIRVDLNGRVLVDEKLYVGDGVNRTILVR